MKSKTGADHPNGRPRNALHLQDVFVQIARVFQKPAYVNSADANHPAPNLSQEQALASAVINTMTAVVIVLDRQGRCIRCNPACERFIGEPFQRLQGRYFWDLFKLKLAEGDIKRKFETLIEQRAVMDHESAVVTTGGQRCWFSWSTAFILDENEQIEYVVGVGTDITERKHRENQQEAFTTLASKLDGEQSVDHMIDLAMECVYQFLPHALVALAESNPSCNDLVIEKAFGESALWLLGKSLPNGVGAPARALSSLQPQLSMDAAADLPWIQPDQAALLKSIAWVPLLTDNRPAALWMVASAVTISETEIGFLAAVANIVAAAINRRVLLDQTQRSLRRLKALSTINIAVSASLDIQVTLRILVNQITAQLGVDAADILLIDPVTRDLRCAAEVGFRSGNVAGTHLWMGQGHAGQAAMQRKSIQLYQPEGITSLFLPERDLAADDFAAYNVVPLAIKGEVRGVLETFHRQPYQPDPEWPQFLESLAAEISIALDNADLVDSLQRNNHALAMAYDATIEGWALALEMRDRQTQNHTRRVTEQTMRLAQTLGIRGDDLKYIRYGALLHDIGKIGIPDSILNKTGPLDDQEWDKMRRHPEYSRQMLSAIPFLSQAMSIPYSHHERWDGSGYPQKLAGQQIPLPARIFAVVDVWDALSFGRVYRDALPEAEVLEYLENNAGVLFDPDVVKSFVALRRMSAA